MATRLKLFAGILLVVCLLQLVEMAPEKRFRRDDLSLEDRIEDRIEKFFEGENTKKLIDSASNAFHDIARNLKSQFRQLEDKLDH